MRKFEGKSVYCGIAIGKIHVMSEKKEKVVRKKAENIEKEISRFDEALKKADRETEELYKKACREIGEAGGAIFDAHRLMLKDDDYVDCVKNIISEQEVNAEYAVAVTSDNFSSIFSAMDDDYMKERAQDVRDISERVIKILKGEREQEEESGENVIILAEDLAPAETVKLDKDKIISFVTVKGSPNSHTSILARTMNIPALIGTGIKNLSEFEGKNAAVDGFEGVLYIEPNEKILNEMENKLSEVKRQRELLQSLKDKENITIDGKKIELYANIGSLKDLALALQNDAGGVGLFRSEFLFLEKDTLPTEEQQFDVYKRAAQAMAGKKVIIRTLDIGADKKSGALKLKSEENPALGMRGIRVCLTHRDIFKTQLRAIMRASKFGKISVMYPMITSPWEIDKIREITDEVREELKAQNIPFNDVEEGIMIETPSAVEMSDELAKKVDFFSVGTNDLTQYTLAVDRQNEKVEMFFDSRHEAVLRMIERACENAHKNGIWIGICGEMGADLSLTKRFLKMGIDELSVAPSVLLSVRKKVRETDLSKE